MEPRVDNLATLPTLPTVPDLPLQPGCWTLDRAHARAGFSVRHLGVSKVRGFFAAVDADLLVGTSPDETTVNAAIDLASIDTGNADRDASLRSAAFLNVEHRPVMTFRSTRVTGSGRNWALEGDLAIGDTTKPITLEVEFGGIAIAFDGKRHAGFEARGELRRNDFGLSFGPLDTVVGQVVKLELDLQFVEPD